MCFLLHLRTILLHCLIPAELSIRSRSVCNAPLGHCPVTHARPQMCKCCIRNQCPQEDWPACPPCRRFNLARSTMTSSVAVNCVAVPSMDCTKRHEISGGSISPYEPAQSLNCMHKEGWSASLPSVAGTLFANHEQRFQWPVALPLLSYILYIEHCTLFWRLRHPSSGPRSSE